MLQIDRVRRRSKAGVNRRHSTADALWQPLSEGFLYGSPYARFEYAFVYHSSVSGGHDDASV